MGLRNFEDRLCLLHGEARMAENLLAAGVVTTDLWVRSNNVTPR